MRNQELLGIAGGLYPMPLGLWIYKRKTLITTMCYSASQQGKIRGVREKGELVKYTSNIWNHTGHHHAPYVRNH